MSKGIEFRESGYAGAIADALNLSEPRQAVESVKQIVIREISELDRGAVVKSTDYFNHTFAPDLVLHWPRDTAVERSVYLRFTDDVEYLADGLSKIDDAYPFVFGLTPPAADARDLQQLDETASRRNALVTDPTALEAFIHEQTSEPVLSLMSNAVVQGGRGFLDHESISSVTNIIANGFRGAMDLDSGPTGLAVGLVDRVLVGQQAGRMSRLLQSMWISSGGSSASFPGRLDISEGLNELGLEFLLNFELVEDLEFWKRLGRRVTISEIAELEIASPSPNLQRLMQANLDHLWARGCAVVPMDKLTIFALDDEDEGVDQDFLWVIDNRCLALKGNGFTAYVSEQVEQVRGRVWQVGPGIDVEELRSRAGQVQFNSLKLSDGRDALMFDSDDVIGDPRLSNLASSFSPSARVHVGQATLESGQNVNLDFRDLVASAVTVSKPLVRDLLEMCVPIFVVLSFEELTSLRQKLATPTELDQPTLFDDL
jgi:hypothetical protein